jgi:hypothetical protein
MRTPYKDDSQNDAHYDSDKEVAKKQFLGVLGQLYSHRDLDAIRLEACLDNLCNYFGVPVCVGDLMIERFQEVKQEETKFLYENEKPNPKVVSSTFKIVLI